MANKADLEEIHADRIYIYLAAMKNPATPLDLLEPVYSGYAFYSQAAALVRL